MKRIIYLLVVFLYYNPAAKAQYQEGLDPYFGTKGIVTHSEAIIKPSGFTDALLQPDGKIVAGANENIARFNPDGTLDKSFGTDGVFKEPIYYFDGSSFIKLTSFFRISARLLLQPDGKIIGMGEAYIPAPFRMVLMIRLLPDGTLDPTFGRNGIVCDTLLGNLKYWQTASLLSDGKIMAVGRYSFGDDYPILVRYTSNGIIDSTFGTYGKVIDTAVHNPMGDITVLPDGKMLVLFDYFTVGRYLPNGSADTTFNHIGYNSIFDKSLGAPFSYAMALRPDGKIWVAGNTLFGNPTTFILGRFNVNGSIDSSFNAIGYKEYLTDTGDENKVRDMLLQPDGKIVLGGRVMNRATKQYNFGLMRILPDGREDSTFGINGRLLTAPNGNKEQGADLKKLLLQIDNKILAMGWSNHFDTSTASSTIVRYYPNGKTSIQTTPYQQQFAIYPNPASTIVHILLTNSTNIEHLSLSNMQGQVIQSWSKVPISNSIDVANVPNGIYFMGITIDGNTKYQKLIITH